MCIRDRNKAGAWMQSTKKLLECGALLLKCEEAELADLTNEWFENLALLRTATGEA